MNLYKVMPNYEYTYFVFAPTRNKAKAACVGFSHEDEKYTDMRCRTLVKDIPCFPCDDLGAVCVVDDVDDSAYEIVKELGFHFEEDIDDYYDDDYFDYGY